MSNEIITAIDHLCDKLGIAVDWTADNALPMIQQLIEKYARYLLVNNIAWFCVWVVLFAICTAVVVVITRGVIRKEAWVLESDIYALVFVVAPVLSGTFFILALVCMSQLIKAATIPEIYAVQELLSMLSNM